MEPTYAVTDVPASPGVTPSQTVGPFFHDALPYAAGPRRRRRRRARERSPSTATCTTERATRSPTRWSRSGRPTSGGVHRRARDLRGARARRVPGVRPVGDRRDGRFGFTTVVPGGVPTVDGHAAGTARRDVGVRTRDAAPRGDPGVLRRRAVQRRRPAAVRGSSAARARDARGRPGRRTATVSTSACRVPTRRCSSMSSPADLVADVGLLAPVWVGTARRADDLRPTPSLAAMAALRGGADSRALASTASPRAGPRRGRRRRTRRRLAARRRRGRRQPDAAAGGRVRAAARTTTPRWVHLGATSQDLVDTALMLVAATPLLAQVESDLGVAPTCCAGLADAHRAVAAAWPARSRQQAMPTTLGLPARRLARRGRTTRSSWCGPACRCRCRSAGRSARRRPTARTARRSPTSVAAELRPRRAGDRPGTPAARPLLDARRRAGRGRRRRAAGSPPTCC